MDGDFRQQIEPALFSVEGILRWLNTVSQATGKSRDEVAALYQPAQESAQRINAGIFVAMRRDYAFRALDIKHKAASGPLRAQVMQPGGAHLTAMRQDLARLLAQQEAEKEQLQREWDEKLNTAEQEGRREAARRGAAVVSVARWLRLAEESGLFRPEERVATKAAPYVRGELPWPPGDPEVRDILGGRL